MSELSADMSLNFTTSEICDDKWPGEILVLRRWWQRLRDCGWDMVIPTRLRRVPPRWISFEKCTYCSFWRGFGMAVDNICRFNICSYGIKHPNHMYIQTNVPVCTQPEACNCARPQRVSRRIRFANGTEYALESDWRASISAPRTSITRHRWSPSPGLPGWTKCECSKVQYAGWPDARMSFEMRCMIGSSCINPLSWRLVAMPVSALMATYRSCLWCERWKTIICSKEIDALMVSCKPHTCLKGWVIKQVRIYLKQKLYWRFRPIPVSWWFHTD